ncbi:amidohydrolase family protein [[Mycobacterium] nativiensis]|uniref:Amidohydrolase family protein n=1 Tax=[Mycobacterium] nativiensis TaxID=2855503 RepID=A0ABU5Y2Y5_9MYCO|nr:amidohydrolase family protein [Mycolicibacter sp. MYC340]MEB3034548.1 amidohydrolase family protein [Mycolicibacter sp. MYC340]
MQIHRGNIVFTPTPQDFVTLANGYVVVDDDGVVAECLPELPDRYAGAPVTDHGDRLLLPGFTDAHVHACQLPITGLQGSTELIDWLHTLTFPQEAALRDPEYADSVYRLFVESLLRNGITSSIVMGSMHAESTGVLVDRLIAAGLRACVAKVSRDQNTPEDCREDTAQELADSRQFLKQTLGKSPLITPAIAPSVSMVCSRELMAGLAQQAAEFDIPCHMHLAENRTEVEVTMQMYPDCMDFVDTYQRADLMKASNTVVAHAIHLNDREKQVIRDTGILVAHCPHSNLNLLSGVMPLAEYHDMGIRVGLGSDISAGHALNMFQNIISTIQSGAMCYLTDRTSRPVLAPEAFYCATKGGGSFFGKVGSFEPGFAFDALVADDSMWMQYKQMTLPQRIEKLIYCGDDRNIEHVYVNGRQLR